MSVYDFEIGASAGSRVPVIALIERQPTACYFRRYAAQYFTSLGHEYGDGYPIATWIWRFLSQSDLNVLHQFCLSDGVYQPSGLVSIKTRDDTGEAVAFSSAVMHWPNDIDQRRRAPGYYSDVEITFTHLEA